jgi:hypothetical protein
VVDVARSGKEATKMAGETWTFWLNMTNFALGIITVLALAVVFVAVGWDLLMLRIHKTRTVNADNNLDAELQAMLNGTHSFAVPELGLTMADGGERIEPSDKNENTPRK